MPLVTFDIRQGRPQGEVTAMLDAAHYALVEAVGVPPRDRYQIVNEHPAGHLLAQDTGLGLTRTEKLTIVRVFSRPRTPDQKMSFYRLLVSGLERACGISPNDVIVLFSINSDEDWSFGLGRAQFIEGDLR